MDDAGASSQASSIRRLPISLGAGQRWASGLFGAAAGGGGTAAVFLTKNQAGATTLLLAGGLGLLMALTGRVPDRIGREGIVHEPVEAPAARTLNDLLTDEGLSREVKTVVAEALQKELSRGDSEANGSLESPAPPPGTPSRALLELRMSEALYEEVVASELEEITLPTGAKFAPELDPVSYASGRLLRPDLAIIPAEGGTPLVLAKCIAIEIKLRTIGVRTAVRTTINQLLDAGFGAAIVISPQNNTPVPPIKGLPSNARHFAYGVITTEGHIFFENGERAHLESEIETLWRQIQPTV